MSRQIKHGQSHASLLRDVSAVGAPAARSRLDAIVVPAARPASALQEVIDLSVALSVQLVILCSREALIADVEHCVEETFGARALVIEVSEDYRLPHDTTLTSAEQFQDVCADRVSDLSLKRNLGLLYGRMRGWNKVLFIDDDISQFRVSDVKRLSGHLDRHAVASMVSRYFPDNSVVCHARRLANLRQDVFVSGAALGVNLRHPALSFFPDIYNEDWFFFSRHAAERSLPKVGDVRQAKYWPFADPGRAAREEFGDLLAEGLYALFDSTSGWDFKDHLAAASRPNHWREFKQLRLDMIGETASELSRLQHNASPVNYLDIQDAQVSLERAQHQASQITPDLCVDFMMKWQADELGWQELLGRYRTPLSEHDAIAELGLSKWTSCGYGKSARYAKPQADLEASGVVG